MHEKTDRLSHVFRELAAPRILEYVREHVEGEHFGVVSVLDIRVTRDYTYADITVTSERDAEQLPAFLAPIAPDIRADVGGRVSIHRIPFIRFRMKKDDGTGDRVYAMINQLSKQYNLSDE